MSAQTFAQMTPARRAFEVENYRELLRGRLRAHGSQPHEDRPFSPSTTAWLRRLQLALADTDCFDRGYRQLHREAEEVIPEDEASEFWGRVAEFAIIRAVFPMDATSAEEALPTIHERLGQVFSESETAA